MDILLQYLNVKKNKQAFVAITRVPCSSVQQAIELLFITGRAVSLIDYLENRDYSPYLFVGLVDAKYCNRHTIASFSYTDFCQLTCGLGEASSID